MTEIPASEAERLAILNEPDALEDLITPEHLLHMSDDELMGEAARFGRTLAKLDERQLMGVAGILFASMLVVMAVLFARQGLKAIRGETPAPIGYRDYG